MFSISKPSSKSSFSLSASFPKTIFSFLYTQNKYSDRQKKNNLLSIHFFSVFGLSKTKILEWFYDRNKCQERNNLDQSVFKTLFYTLKTFGPTDRRPNGKM